MYSRDGINKIGIDFYRKLYNNKTTKLRTEKNKQRKIADEGEY